MSSINTCCKSKGERYQMVSGMTHEERLQYAQRTKSHGIAMVFAGLGVFGGLMAALWNTISAGAIGVGAGAASGIWFGSCCGPFHASKETLSWDEEIEQQQQQQQQQKQEKGEEEA